jgi:hypothetical protein
MARLTSTLFSVNREDQPAYVLMSQRLLDLEKKVAELSEIAPKSAVA